MNKSKKIFMIIAGVIALIAIIVALIVSGGNNKGEIETIGETTQSVTTTEFPTIEDLEILETDEKGEVVTEKETKKENNEDSETTNYWENVEIYEDGGDVKPLLDEEGETMTDGNGEVVMEEYPGQNDGWSPIVKPEDLE